MIYLESIFSAFYSIWNLNHVIEQPFMKLKNKIKFPSSSVTNLSSRIYSIIKRRFVEIKAIVKELFIHKYLIWTHKPSLVRECISWDKSRRSKKSPLSELAKQMKKHVIIGVKSNIYTKKSSNCWTFSNAGNKNLDYFHVCVFRLFCVWTLQFFFS